MKEHRGLRRFHCRGLNNVRAEIGALVLANNILAVEAMLEATKNRAANETPQDLCLA